mmetsp:Transcript_36262/g.71343  ORF Transcript_36262/g.71343 Transcript_36262/m.71343 type:complete len:205 (-) Transcript_36262:368-982(-)
MCCLDHFDFPALLGGSGGARTGASLRGRLAELVSTRATTKLAIILLLADVNPDFRSPLSLSDCRSIFALLRCRHHCCIPPVPFCRESHQRRGRSPHALVEVICDKGHGSLLVGVRGQRGSHQDAAVSPDIRILFIGGAPLPSRISGSLELSLRGRSGVRALIFTQRLQGTEVICRFLQVDFSSLPFGFLLSFPLIQSTSEGRNE